MLDYSMSTGGLYPAPAPAERIPAAFINPVSSDPIVNGNSYVCLVPFFNRLVQNSGLIQGTSGLVPGSGFIQNSSLTGNYTPIIMETTQTPTMVRSSVSSCYQDYFLSVRIYILMKVSRSSHFLLVYEITWYLRSQLSQYISLTGNKPLSVREVRCFLLRLFFLLRNCFLCIAVHIIFCHFCIRICCLLFQCF